MKIMYDKETDTVNIYCTREDFSILGDSLGLASHIGHYCKNEKAFAAQFTVERQDRAGDLLSICGESLTEQNIDLTGYGIGKKGGE